MSTPAQRRAYRRANPEKFRAASRELWAKTPIEKKREKARQWRERNPLGVAWNRYMSNTALHSRRRGHEFSLSHSEFDSLVTARCFYCGAEPDPTNGIDRMDNAKGYIQGNVVTACTRCNQAKHRMALGEFVGWLLRAAEHLRAEIRPAEKVVS